ncbi:MAG: hypothetical protein IKF42_12825 [Mogibacterium sp.]|nr:hypothetical protein [Mogibacterium sp.]
MSSIYMLAGAAMPWIALGLLLAVFCVRASSGKMTQKKKDDYSSEGMSIGMCFGVAVASALHMNLGLGMILGMLLGLIIDSVKEKEDDK